MRRLLLFLMIVIAPLRSMAGDLMALEMATQQFAAVADGRGAAVSEAEDRQYAGGSLPGPHSDCMEQSIVRASDAGPADQQPDGSTASHCQTCSRCQVCSSAAFALYAYMADQWLSAHGMPIASSLEFSSADAERGFKPPIS